MAIRKVYFNDDFDLPEELTAKKNDDGDLFITITDRSTTTELCVCIPQKDAITLISELAFQFNLIDDDMELEGKMMWKGNSR